MLQKLLKASLLSLCALLFACNGPDTPEAALRDFIHYRFKGSFEREKVLEKSTGELYGRIEAMDDQEFSEFSRDNLSDSFSLKILLSKCEENKCFLTYTLAYDMNETTDASAEMEVKKIAELHRVEKTWKVADVSELKTYIQMNKQLDITAP